MYIPPISTTPTTAHSIPTGQNTSSSSFNHFAVSVLPDKPIARECWAKKRKIDEVTTEELNLFPKKFLKLREGSPASIDEYKYQVNSDLRNKLFDRISPATQKAKKFTEKGSSFVKSQPVYVTAQYPNFPCLMPTCKKSYKKASQRATHMYLDHHLYYCSRCDNKSYSTMANLMSHKNKHHSGLTLGFQCHIENNCNQELESQDTIRLHEMYHLNIEDNMTRYNCNTCQLGYDKLQNLNRHINSEKYKKKHRIISL